MRAGRSVISGDAIAALTLGLLVGVAAPASAALPTGSSTTGVTGARPGATELSFGVSDQVTASVDVATGNLRVQNSSLSLVGVTGDVALTQTYNSLSTATGATSTAAANKWTWSVQGAGFLAAGTSGVVVYTDGSGATWPFTPVYGTPGAFTSPAGAKADLTSSGGSFVLTDRQSRQATTFNSDGRPVSVADRNSNITTLTYSGAIPATVVSSAGPVAARTATLAYSSGYYTLTATQTSGSLTRNVRYVKNSASNLVSIVDAENKTTSFGYAGQLLTTITGPTGAVVTIGYEAGTNRVASVSQGNTTAGDGAHRNSSELIAEVPQVAG